MPKAMVSRKLGRLAATNVVSAEALPTELVAEIGTCEPAWVMSKDCSSMRSPWAKARTLVTFVLPVVFKTAVNPATADRRVALAGTVYGIACPRMVTVRRSEEHTSELQSLRHL